MWQMWQNICIRMEIQKASRNPYQQKYQKMSLFQQSEMLSLFSIKRTIFLNNFGMDSWKYNLSTCRVWLFEWWGCCIRVCACFRACHSRSWRACHSRSWRDCRSRSWRACAGVYICGGLKIWRPFFKLSTIVLYFLIDLIIFYLINRDTFILSWKVNSVIWECSGLNEKYSVDDEISGAKTRRSHPTTAKITSVFYAWTNKE